MLMKLVRVRLMSAAGVVTFVFHQNPQENIRDGDLVRKLDLPYYWGVCFNKSFPLTQLKLQIGIEHKPSKIACSLSV